MMTCPQYGQSDIFSVIEVIEQRIVLRCTDKDHDDCIEVEATLAHARDTVTCSACGHECDEDEGRDARSAAHGELQEEHPCNTLTRCARSTASTTATASP